MNILLLVYAIYTIESPVQNTKKSTVKDTHNVVIQTRYSSCMAVLAVIVDHPKQNPYWVAVIILYFSKYSNNISKNKCSKILETTEGTVTGL